MALKTSRAWPAHFEKPIPIGEDVASRIGARAAVLLADLLETSVLTTCQRNILTSDWPLVDADYWAQPWLRTVPEHTRAEIERLATQARRQRRELG